MKKASTTRYGRPAFVVSASASSWISCQTISPNLVKAYEQVFGDQKDIFQLATNFSNEMVRKLAIDILAASPDRLIFIDHVPHPGRLLSELAKVYGRRQLPDLYVHVYGDFSLFTADWLAVEPALRKARVCWISASDRQREFVAHYLSKPRQAMTKKCPFPVDSRNFYFDPEIRRVGRNRLKALPDERLVLYSGRVSFQKNVILLAKCFLQETDGDTVPSRLLIAGSFDDIGSPFFGFEPLRGTCFQQWTQFLSDLPSHQASRIQYLGQLGQPELLEVYNASDLGVSLSLHHDEDFGMSPAEALCTGSPLVLTDWGGYSSFADREGYCKLVPLSLRSAKFGPAQMISFSKFRGLLRRRLDAPFTESDRVKCAEVFQQKFSVQSCAEQLVSIHQARPVAFTGFNRLMRIHAQKLMDLQREKRPMFQLAVQKDQFYDQVYRPYFG